MSPSMEGNLSVLMTTSLLKYQIVGCGLIYSLFASLSNGKQFLRKNLLKQVFLYMEQMALSVIIAHIIMTGEQF